MTGSIDLAPDGATLLIRFPYREDLLEEVRTIPGRRWDKGGKVWRAPVQHVDLVVAAFLKHGFELAPEVSGLLAGTVAKAEPNDKRALFDTAAPVAEPQAALTLTILNERVRSAVRAAFHSPVWVVGEVQDFDKGRNRKHAFFALVEKTRGQDEPAARAEIALFAATAERLAGKLVDEQNRCWLRDGIEVRLLVRVDLYPTTGRYQLVVEDIDPAFTLGKLALGREAILAELRHRGLERRNRELVMPVPPLRVGVLTSVDSDAWNDFAARLRDARIPFAVTCYDVRVQGRELRPTMLAGLRWFAQQAAEFDVLCVLRGGGSRTDLAWFDDRDIALAVAQHPLKVVCGIGHQRDQSVLDVIAHSETTPTAVASFLIEHVRDAEQALAGQARRLATSASGQLLQQQRRLTSRGQTLLRGLDSRLSAGRQRLAAAGPRLARAAATALARRRERLQARAHQLRERASRSLERAAAQLAQQAARQRLLDPRAVLRRGYALVRGPSGVIIKTVAALRPGTELDIALRDGRIRATTTEIHGEEATHA